MMSVFDGDFDWDEFTMDSEDWTEICDLIRRLSRGKPPTKYGWTDEMFLIDVQKRCIWKEIPTNEVERHLINFANLWFSGSKSTINAQNLCAIIRNVLLMTPIGMSDELLFRDVFDSALDTAQVPSTIQDGENCIIEQPLIDHLDSDKKADVLAFHNWTKQHLDLLKMLGKRISEDEPQCPEYNVVSQRLRIVLGFCALILMRGTTKNQMHINNFFPYRASKTFDRLFSNTAELTVSLVAPAPEFLKLALEMLSISDSSGTEIQNLRHSLIFQYLKSLAKDDESSKFAKEILEEGCLNVIAGNGMGLVTMFQDLKLMYSNIEERLLLSTICDQQSDTESQERLIKFLDIYTQKDKPQYSWKWARILSPDYFSDLNIRDNQALCSKFAALLVDKNPGIFQHKDLKTPNRFADRAIQWAETAKKDLKKLDYEFQQASDYVII